MNEPMKNTQKCKIAYIVLLNTKKSEVDKKSGIKKNDNNKRGRNSRRILGTYNNKSEERVI